MLTAHLTDTEVADICRPLVQHAARIRYLRALGLRVQRRPDGSPLVARSDWERLFAAQNGKPANGPNWSRQA